MIAWLLKNWKLFLDIIVVVGGIILLTIFDPFGIFSNRSLKNTANILSSVKDIGELVTAEYYGEVISSLQGTQIYDLEVDSLTPQFQNCFVDLKYLLASNILDKVGDRPRLRKKEKDNLLDDIVDKQLKDITLEYKANDIWYHLVAFIGYNLVKNDESRFYDTKKKELKRNAEKPVFDVLLNQIYRIVENTEPAERSLTEGALSEYVYSIPDYFKNVVDFHYRLNKKEIKNEKKDIVFIGRGWVKAGFRFDKLDKSNFYYDRSNKIIRFYGLSPVILDNDINPWFIPEKRVKGFELVDFYKKATFEEAIAVKIRCKQELLQQAYTADILGQAKMNGEESLRSFFALLTNEPDLQVEFHDLPYQKELNSIAADTLVIVAEAMIIDTIVQRLSLNISKSISPVKENNEELLSIFLNQLSDLWFVGKGTKFNIFMLDAARILDHKLLVSWGDYNSIKKLRKPILTENNPENEKVLTAEFSDTILHRITYPDFVNQFNDMLNILEAEVEKVDYMREDTIQLDSAQIRAYEIDPAWFRKFPARTIVGADTLNYFKVVHEKPEREFRFTDLNYPELVIPEAAYDTLSISDTVKVDDIINKIAGKLKITTGDAYGDSLRKADLAKIKEYESWRIKYEIKTRPVKRFTSAVKKIFSN